jgi:hypothetical protein
MSRSSFIHLAPLALAAIAGAGLAQPSTGAAQAVTAEQALLNQTPASMQEPTAPFSTVSSGSLPSGGNQVSGDRALLGRVELPSGLERYFGTDSLADALIDGERALLGRWPVQPNRQSGDWAGRASKADTSS